MMVIDGIIIETPLTTLVVEGVFYYENYLEFYITRFYCDNLKSH